MSILQKDKEHVWHPFTQHQTEGTPLEIVKAKGTKLIAADGKEYIDVNSSWWVNVHGHGHPYIGNAIQKQFSEIDHVIFAGVTHPKAVELAERVCDLLPVQFRKVFFSDNGSTAVEVALKMAFQYFYNTGKSKNRILALEGSYHGDTFGAMSVGQRDYFNKPFEHFFFDVDFLDFPDGSNEDDLIRSADKLFSTGDFAGLIVEPLVQGASGMRMYSSGFLDRLTAIARKHDVLIIFDEVMTGWGRTGTLFALDQCDVKPDIICLSKGLTGGVLPLSLTVTTDNLFEAFLSDDKARALLHGHSYTANPLSCAAACASLDLFELEDTVYRIQQLCQWNDTLLEELKQIGNLKDVRCCGTILAVELESRDASYFSDIRNRAYSFFLDHGILLRPLGNVIFINPPYCITNEEYQQVKNSVLKFIHSLDLNNRTQLQ